MVLVKHPDFGHIARVVAQDDELADIGCQGWVHVTKALEPQAVTTDFSRFGYG
jgi:hypothetical protein